MCNTDMTPLTHILATHTEQLNNLMAGLRHSIPVYVNERQWPQSGATTIVLIPQSHNLEIITKAIIYITAPTGGTLQIGVDRVIPLPQGLTIWDNLVWQLKETDTRQLVQNTAGAMGLELMGLELVDKGPF